MSDKKQIASSMAIRSYFGTKDRPVIMQELKDLRGIGLSGEAKEEAKRDYNELAEGAALELGVALKVK